MLEVFFFFQFYIFEYRKFFLSENQGQLRQQEPSKSNHLMVVSIVPPNEKSNQAAPNEYKPVLVCFAK